MTKQFGSKQIIPLITTAIGAVFLVMGLSKFGFWETGKGPTPAFVPSIIAVLLVLSSLLALVQSFKETEKAQYKPENFMVILSAIAIFLLTFVIGLLPCIALYVLLWLKFYEKTPWKQTIIVLVSIMAILIGVFVLWLKVPFPQGFIIDALMN